MTNHLRAFEQQFGLNAVNFPITRKLKPQDLKIVEQGAKITALGRAVLAGIDADEDISG